MRLSYRPIKVSEKLTRVTTPNVKNRTLTTDSASQRITRFGKRISVLGNRVRMDERSRSIGLLKI